MSVQSYPGHTTHFFLCVLTSVNINQCTSSAISYNNIHFFSFVIMSSFLLKKKHMREALLFCFNLKKSAAESHRMFVEAYGDNALSETTCRNRFRRFNADNFDLSDKKRENRPRKVRTINCRLFWTRTIPNRKKCLSSNWVFLKQPFSCGYMPWGRFQKIGKWVPHELNDRQMERRQNMPNSACQTKKKVVPASDCDRR